MWQRRYINNLSNFNPCTVNRPDSRLTPVTRPFHVCLYLSQTKIVSNFGTILGSHLCCIRSVLLRTSKPHFSGRRPRNNLSFAICQRNNNVVER